MTTSIEDRIMNISLEVSRLDAANMRDFKSEFAHAWQDGIQTITIDFSKVEFIDSSGIGALLSAHKKLDPSSGSVVLLNVREQVQAVIELLRLHRIFEIRH